MKTLENPSEALPRSFYEPSAQVVAPQLLGHWLIRNTASGPCGGPIVETEAYLWDDPACHAARGLTPRNRVMFGGPGHGYVYLIYGYHFCVNAVCRPAGVAEAVLLRAIEPLFCEDLMRHERPATKTGGVLRRAIEPLCGEDLMRHERPVTKARELTNGPAKLCEALKIDRGLDGVNLCDPKSALFIAENPEVERFRQRTGPVITTTRIGITRAASLPLRFYLEGSSFVSQRAVSRR